MIPRPGRAIAAIGVIALIIGVTSMDESTRSTTPDPASAAAEPAATPFTDVGATPDDRDVSVDLVLAFPGRDAMQAYALSVGDPESPDYRHFLTAEEIGSRFGPDDAVLRSVAAWADEHGLAVVATTPQRTTVSLVAPARAIEAAFGVALRILPMPMAASTTPRPRYRPSRRRSTGSSPRSTGSTRDPPSARRSPGRSPQVRPAG